MKNIAGNLLTLGITTKGRVDELVETLRLIEASELKSCPIILIDDGGGGQFIEAAEFDLDLNNEAVQTDLSAYAEVIFDFTDMVEQIYDSDPDLQKFLEIHVLLYVAFRKPLKSDVAIQA